LLFHWQRESRSLEEVLELKEMLLLGPVESIAQRISADRLHMLHRLLTKMRESPTGQMSARDAEY
jgi:hypothetical protein